MDTRDTIPTIDNLLKTTEHGAARLRIASQLGVLQGKTRQIVRYLIEHSEESGRMTVDEIASACETSRSTVFRAARELGYPRFSDLRREILSDASDASDAGPSCSSASGALRGAAKRTLTMLLDTYGSIDYDALRQAAGLMAAANSTIIYGSGMNGAIGRILQLQLQWVGAPAMLSGEPEEVYDLISSPRIGLLCYISHDGASLNVRRLLSCASQQGVPSVLITNQGTTEACGLAAVVLRTGISSVRTSAREPLARASYLLLVELLSQEVARVTGSAHERRLGSAVEGGGPHD